MLTAAIAQLLLPPATSSVDVVVDGVVECDGRGLEREVSRRVAETGRSTEFTQAFVVVRKESGLWTADLQVSTRSGSGTRRLSANSCDALIDDVAFVLTFAARGDSVGATVSEPDDAREAGRAELEAAEAAEDSADPAPETGPEVPPARTSPPPNEGASAANTSADVRSRPSVDLVTGGGVHMLSLPNVGGVAEVGLGLQYDRWRGEVGYVQRVRREFRYAPNRGVRLSTHKARVRACFVPRIRQGPRVVLCTGTAIGSFHARGTGELIPRSGAKVWWTGLASAGLRWRGARWLSVGPDATLELPILRPGVSVAGDGTVATVGPVGVSATLVLQWTLRQEKDKGGRVSADGGKP